MISITRRFEFAAGHRINEHESKCRNIHGHNWAVDVTVTPADGESLDRLGRVIDFSEVKAIIGGWIDDKLDHGMILSRSDILLKSTTLWSSDFGEPEHKIYVMNRNPTAENIAIEIHNAVGVLFKNKSIPLVCTKVVVFETNRSSATYEDR